jgi:hypothetical protein
VVSVVTAIKSSEMLIEGVLDNGLTFIGEYLEKILRHEIIITDHLGKIYFPESNDHILDRDSMFVNVSEWIGNKEFYYCPDSACLYYGVESNHHLAYVIVKNFDADLLPQVSNVLRDCRLPIKCYFSKINKSKELFTLALTEYLFGAGQADIKDILRTHDDDLDVNRLYFSLLLNVDEMRANIDPGIVLAYVREYLQQGKLKTISAYHQNQWVFLVPARFRDDCRSNDIDSIFDLKAIKKVIENKFKSTFSIGVGQVYALIDLKKSFLEARIAMILSQLTGQKGFLQKFSDLGIYQPLFLQEMNYIYKYCSNTLGKLIEHDCKNDGELLPTLRKLLDTGGNNKATADQLYIHVNTLYYRINKIEQILNIDLARMNARVELYTAIKVWDTLQVLNGKERIAAVQPVALAMQA